MAVLKEVPPVAKLGHVAAETPDLEESVWFFRDVIGLKEVERVDDTVYLRGMRDWDHHTLSLTASDSPGIDHIGWRATTPEALDAVEVGLEEQGLASKRIEAGEEPGVGEAVRFKAPTGHQYELYYDVEQPDAPDGEASKLHNRVYSTAVANRVAPRRIDHVHVQDPDGRAHADWLMDTLGFGMNEILKEGDDEEWGWWLSVTPLPHDIGVHRFEDAPSRFHHICYHVDKLQELWDAADICREYGIAPDGGPGMHAITKADYFYVKDPASDIRLELFAGPGYLNFEPDWDPIVWEEGDIGTAADHQWIGTQYSSSGTPYTEGYLD